MLATQNSSVYQEWNMFNEWIPSYQYNLNLEKAYISFEQPAIILINYSVMMQNT